MANLSTLRSLMDLYMRTSATDYLNNRTTWINNAIRRLCLNEPFWFTREDQSLATVSGQSSYTLTNEIARFSAVWRDGSTELFPFDQGSTPLFGSTNASPTHYRKGAALKEVVLAPTPNGVYTIRYIYHKPLADLAADGDSNALTDTNPYIPVFSALIEAALHLGRDPSLWKTRLEEELAGLRNQSVEMERSAG